MKKKQTPEHIAKRIASRKANGQPWHSEESRKNQGLALKGRIVTKRTRKLISEAKKGKPQSPEHIALRIKNKMATMAERNKK